MLLSSTSAAQHDDIESGVFPLPSDRTYDNIEGQGWQVATTVRQSKIPGAGYGRFADVDVPKDTVMMAKTLIPMSEVSSIYSVADDVTLFFKDEDDIEKFISLYEKEGQQTRENIIDCLSHYMWTLSNLNGVGCHWTPAAVNHGDPGKGDNNTNLILREDGMIVVEALTDVKAGDELLCDYSLFEPMEKFWVQYCDKVGQKDVVTNIKQYVDL